MRTLVGGEATPYERSALESALVDLAMRQAGHSLEDLVGSRPGRMRWVVLVRGRGGSRDDRSGAGARAIPDRSSSWTCIRTGRTR